MSELFGLKEIMEEHEKVVKQLEEMGRFCTKEASADKYYTINLFNQEVNVLRKCFESVSRYYQFSAREYSVVNSLIDSVLATTESFVVNKERRD